MHWFLLAAAIKFHGLGGLNNGNLFSHTSRVYKFLIKVPQGQKSHLAGLYSCGLTWPFLVNGERERVRETLLIKPLILSIRATHFMIWFNCVCMHAQLLSCVRLFATVSPVAHQTPLFMGLSRREYWSGLPFSPPGDRPNPKDRTHVSWGSCICRWILHHWEAPNYPLKLSLQIQSHQRLRLGLIIEIGGEWWWTVQSILYNLYSKPLLYRFIQKSNIIFYN